MPARLLTRGARPPWSARGSAGPAAPGSCTAGWSARWARPPAGLQTKVRHARGALLGMPHTPAAAPPWPTPAPPPHCRPAELHQPGRLQHPTPPPTTPGPAPSRYVCRAANRLTASRCTQSEAAVSQRENSVQMPGREGMNCGLKPPAAGGRTGDEQEGRRSGWGGAGGGGRPCRRRSTSSASRCPGKRVNGHAACSSAPLGARTAHL